jgi:hypothetical protein
MGEQLKVGSQPPEQEQVESSQSLPSWRHLLLAPELKQLVVQKLDEKSQLHPTSAQSVELFPEQQ